MDFIALTLGIILIIVGIFFLLFKKSLNYVERKNRAIILFIFGIVWILIAFITNRKLTYLIIGSIFIIIGIWLLYLKKKNPENKTNQIILAIINIGLGIFWVLTVFIPD